MKVVMYHYVKPAANAPSALHWVTLEHFRHQLDSMLSTGNIIHPKELLNKDFEPRPNDFLLTFDDALSDHYHFVFPELTKRNVSALFFVNGLQYAQKRILNVHRLHYLLHHHFSDHLLTAFSETIDFFKGDVQLAATFGNELYANMEERDSLVAAIKKLLNFHVDPILQNEIAGDLFGRFAGNENEPMIAREWYLSEQQIAAMAASNMVFGAHGFSHYVLSNFSAPEQESDILKSVHFVAEATNQPVSFFCYPYGYASSFNDTTIACLKNAGIQFAFSVEHQEVDKLTLLNRPYRITRFDCTQF